MWLNGPWWLTDQSHIIGTCFIYDSGLKVCIGLENSIEKWIKQNLICKQINWVSGFVVGGLMIHILDFIILKVVQHWDSLNRGPSLEFIY